MLELYMDKLIDLFATNKDVSFSQITVVISSHVHFIALAKLYW